MEGGRYVVINGMLQRVEDPTQPHPQGAAPRDADGRRLDRPVLPEPVPHPSASDQNAKKGGRDASEVPG